jgi:lysophospholipase L1-like esterase
MASRFIIPTADVGSGISPSRGAQLFFSPTGVAFDVQTQDTYPTEADAIAKTNANANPVIADGNGVFPDIWIEGSYKVVLKDKNDVQTGFGESDPVISTISNSDLTITKATIAAAKADTSLENLIGGFVVAARDDSANDIDLLFEIKAGGFGVADEVTLFESVPSGLFQLLRVDSRSEFVTYDKTGTSLAADDVQAAITELDATDTAQSVDITDINTRSLVSLKNHSLGIIGTEKAVASGFNAKGAINIIGDSISHGAFALNLYDNGWTRLFARMMNAENGTSSYGYTPYLSLGSGPTLSTDVHSVSFNGTWEDVGDSNNSLSGLILTNAVTTSFIQFIVPSFQNRVKIWYVTQPGGGTFDIEMNAVVVDTIDTDGTLDYFSNVEVAVVDGNYGSFTLKIVNTVAGAVGFAGISYLSAAVEATVNNFSNSGRQLTLMADGAITHICENSSVLIMALGHNDADSPTFTAKIDKLISECNTNDVKLYVPDFRWTSAPTDAVRLELKRLADEVNGATYIPLPDYIKPDGSTVDATYLTTTLGMWEDASHPNPKGNQWIVETIAAVMGLGVTSKRQALEYYDYWFPLALNAAALVENSLPTGTGTVSAFKRHGNELMIKCFLQKETSGSFPAATYAIQLLWPVKSGFAGTSQGVANVVLTRQDTGVIVSDVDASASGAINLNVRDGTWINDQSFHFTMPIFP